MEAIMTTMAAAFQKFVEGFGIPAYAATAVPDDAVMPYITYVLIDGDILSEKQNIEVDIWYYGDSEAEPNAKATQLKDYIGLGGKIIKYDDGALWIKRGNPFCQSVAGDDDKVKRRYINLSVEFITK